jgi:hypothetical protein
LAGEKDSGKEKGGGKKLGQKGGIVLDAKLQAARRRDPREPDPTMAAKKIKKPSVKKENGESSSKSTAKKSKKENGVANGK